MHFEPARAKKSTCGRRRARKTPNKKCQACPPFGGFKMAHSDRQATRKTPKTKLTSVSPLQEFYNWQFRSASDQKNAPQKMSIVLSLLQGSNRRYLSHVRRTLVWGAKFTKKSSQTARPYRNSLRCVKLTRSVKISGNARKGLRMSGGLLTDHCP